MAVQYFRFGLFFCFFYSAFGAKSHVAYVTQRLRHAIIARAIAVRSVLSKAKKKFCLFPFTCPPKKLRVVQIFFYRIITDFGWEIAGKN